MKKEKYIEFYDLNEQLYDHIFSLMKTLYYIFFEQGLYNFIFEIGFLNSIFIVAITFMFILCYTQRRFILLGKLLKILLIIVCVIFCVYCVVITAFYMFLVLKYL